MSEYKNLQKFKFWCCKVLPLVYDDSLSYYELLCKVVKYINDMIENQRAFAEDLAELGEDVTQLKVDVKELQDELDKVKNGDYVSLYIDSLKNFIDNNLEALVGRVVKFVNFGLSADGYFTALIPSTWEFIHFDTIMDSDSELYGHLILNW